MYVNGGSVDTKFARKECQTLSPEPRGVLAGIGIEEVAPLSISNQVNSLKVTINPVAFCAQDTK